MAYFKINEISREPDTGLIYLDVDFWSDQSSYDAGDPPIVSNDFRMQLFRQRTHIATAPNGFYLTTSRMQVDPASLTMESNYDWAYVTETLTQDEIIAQVETNIRKFANLIKDNLRGNLKSSNIKRDQNDISGILTELAPIRDARGTI